MFRWGKNSNFKHIHIAMDKFQENMYQNFSEADLMNDPFFQDLIINQTEETEQFWQNFLETHPQKQTSIETARLFLQEITFEEEIPDDSRIHDLYLQHLAQVKPNKKSVVIRFFKTYRKLASVAAAIAGIIVLLSVVLWLNTKSSMEQMIVATRFGEIKNVQLPDGSTIVLNANSSIAFSKNWQPDSAREVWLEGEGFFSVNHLNKDGKDIKANERFIVHGAGFTIEVLGTSFDVRQRRGKTEVMLQTGKIMLTVGNNSSPVVLSPGDLVSYTIQSNTIVKSNTVPENYSGWKEKKLQLHDPTLEEIARYLEDNYGKQIIIQDTKLRMRKIEGVIQLNNLDDALFIISTVLNTNIEKQEARFIITPK